MNRLPPRMLPGFGLTLGFTLTYLGLVVVLPLGALIFQATTTSPLDFLRSAFHPRALSAYWISFITAATAAILNTFVGLLFAWVLVRYQFPGRRFMDALIDLPFALPTSVAGLIYSTLYSEKGWMGEFIGSYGIHLSHSWWLTVMVLLFTGFPFVVRTVQPVLEELDGDLEEAAAILGASRFQTFYKVILPSILPALITGFSLAFARGLGEYGSIVFVSSNLPYRSETGPVLIVSRLKENAINDATATAIMMLIASFGMLLLINALQRRGQTNG